MWRRVTIGIRHIICVFTPTSKCPMFDACTHTNMMSTTTLYTAAIPCNPHVLLFFKLGTCKCLSKNSHAFYFPFVIVLQSCCVGGRHHHHMCRCARHLCPEGNLLTPHINTNTENNGNVKWSFYLHFGCMGQSSSHSSSIQYNNNTGNLFQVFFSFFSMKFNFPQLVGFRSNAKPNIISLGSHK